MPIRAVFLSVLFLSTVAWAANNPPPAAPASAPAPVSEDMPSNGIEVMKMVLCKEVKDRECAVEATAPKVGDTLIGWTQIRSGLGEVTVTHRWLRDKENVGDVPLTIKSSPYRTWSRKTISDAGNWTWQVLNSSGVVLKETSFTVTP